MLNPFFQQGSSGEQSLVQDLINGPRIYGIDVHYMPRKYYYNTKTVIKETVDSRFDDAYPIRHMLKVLMDMEIILHYFQSLDCKQQMK